jgi:hypothetical protein
MYLISLLRVIKKKKRKEYKMKKKLKNEKKNEKSIEKKKLKKNLPTCDLLYLQPPRFTFTLLSCDSLYAFVL